MTKDSQVVLRLDMSLAQAEGEYIKAILKNSGFNKTVAAKKLGIARATLYRKMDEHGITLKSFIEVSSAGSENRALAL
jgi:DNA-binding NtrC family response regulator